MFWRSVARIRREPSESALQSNFGISVRVGCAGGENDNPATINQPPRAQGVEVDFEPGPTSHRDILELLVQTRVDVEIEGERFEAGSQRVMFYAAANHDPLAFPDPDRFDIARSATGHLAFSAGPHYCLGAPLARMEAEIGLSTLFRRIPGLVTGQPIWRGSAPLRQIESLPVEADPRRTELPSPSQDSPDPAGSIKSWEPSCTIRRVCRLYARPTGETRFRI
jgi:Cytochrome P450